jgi:hypothetical protein
MIIAHCRRLFDVCCPDISFNNIFSKIFLEVLLALIDKSASLLVDFLQETLYAPFLIPVDLLAYSLALLLICGRP